MFLDGVINGSDYTTINNAFNRQVAMLAASLAKPATEMAVHAFSIASIFSQDVSSGSWEPRPKKWDRLIDFGY
jgi:hypothetical protein